MVVKGKPEEPEHDEGREKNHRDYSGGSWPEPRVHSDFLRCPSHAPKGL
jgi:hypothetical protein